MLSKITLTSREPFKSQRSHWLDLAVLMAFVMFILFRWHVINVIWEGRLTPPEPDDSFSYITQVRILGDKGCYLYDLRYILPWYHPDHLAYTPWCTILSIVKIVSSLFVVSTYVDVYKVNFYFGIIFIAFIILRFLKVLEKDKVFWIFALLFLTLYNGHPKYHGFFWVIPSFYSLAVTLLLISLVFDVKGKSHILGKRWCVLLFLVTFLTVWLHPLGAFAYIAVLLSFIIFAILTKFFKLGVSTSTLLRMATVFIISGVVAVFSKEVLPYLFGITPSARYTLLSVVQAVSTESNSFEVFKEYYLNYFGFGSYGIVLLGTGLFTTLLNKRISLFSVYLSFFIVSLGSAIFNDLGYRFLLYLWPLTFFIYSYGFYYLTKVLIDNCKLSFNKVGKRKFKIVFGLNRLVTILTFIAMLFSVNYVYTFVQQNYEWNINFCQFFNDLKSDWIVDKSIEDYLRNVTNPNDLIIFADKNAFYMVVGQGLLDRHVAYANWDWDKLPRDWQCLLEKVNGSYIISTGGLQVNLVKKLIEAFEGKITFYFMKNFGVLNVYRIAIMQTAPAYPIVYEGNYRETIIDDFQSSLWLKSERIKLTDDDEVKFDGENALRITLFQNKRGQNDFIIYTFHMPQDWIDKDLLSFYWYGTGSGKRVEFLVVAPELEKRLDFIFNDNFNGWRQITVYIKDFVHELNVSSTPRIDLYFRFTLDSPYMGNFWLDRVALGVEPKGKGDVRIMSDNLQTFTYLLVTFLAVSLLPGLIWARLLFQVQSWVDTIAFGLGLSFVLNFLAMFLLNITLGITISRFSVMFIMSLITLLPVLIIVSFKLCRCFGGKVYD